MSNGCTFTKASTLVRLDKLRAALGVRKQRTAAELGKVIGMSESRLGEYIRYLRGIHKIPHPQEIRIVAWRPSKGTQLTPVYAIGTAPDEPRPIAHPGHPHGLTFTLPSSLAKLAKIRAVLATGPRMAVELDDPRLKIHASPRRIRESLRYLKGEHPNAPTAREVFICGWAGVQNRSPVYALGNLPDVPRPLEDRKVQDLRYYREKIADPRRKARLRFMQRQAGRRRNGTTAKYIQPELAMMFAMHRRWKLAEPGQPRPIVAQLLERRRPA